MPNPVTDDITQWKTDANTTDTNLPQGASTMQPGSATELAGELRRIKSETRAMSLDLPWVRWKGQYGVLSFVDPTHFTLTGDQRFPAGPVAIGRRIRATLTSGFVYGYVLTSSFGAGLTEVGIVGGPLDLSLSEIAFGGDAPSTQTSVAPALFVKVFNNADISIPNNVVTTLSFNSVRFNTLSPYFYSSLPTDRLQIPFKGVWQIVAQVVFNAAANGTRAVALEIGGSTIIDETRIPGTSAGSAGITATTQYVLAPGGSDYVQVLVHQDSGGAINVNADGGTGFRSPTLSMCYLGTVE